MASFFTRSKILRGIQACPCRILMAAFILTHLIRSPSYPPLLFLSLTPPENHDGNIGLDGSEGEEKSLRSTPVPLQTARCDFHRTDRLGATGSVRRCWLINHLVFCFSLCSDGKKSISPRRNPQRYCSGRFAQRSTAMCSSTHSFSALYSAHHSYLCLP